jgi:type I restriction enzyme S subunit
MDSGEWKMKNKESKRRLSHSQLSTINSQLPKGYKQTEVGVIPNDWEILTIEQISSVGRGRVINHKEIGRSKNPLYPVYSSQTSSNGIMGYLDTYEFDGEYITWTTDGANAGTVFYRTGRFNCTNVCGTIKLFRGNYRLVALLLSKIAPSHVSRQLGNPKLMNDVMKKVGIPLPPTLAEQEAIASALSDADAYIESLEKLIAKKRLVKQGAMQELLSGKRRLPGFSGKWEEEYIDELFDFFGGTTASRDQLGTEGYCYLHYGDIHTSKKTFIDLPSESYDIPKFNISLSRIASGSLLKDGDVVFVDASEDDEGASRHIVIDNPLNVPFISGLHTIVARSKTANVDNVYKRFCFQTSAVKKQFLFFAVGTKVTGISKSNIGKITIPLPSLPEQSAIAQVLSDMDAEIEALEAKHAKARKLKEGMMQQLLTGRIRLI